MATTRLVGLIGYPVGHSRSPAMQQAAFDALGIAARYLLWETPPDALAERIASLREPDMLGANVTIPYKTAVAPLLDALASSALRAGGTVNTIVRGDDGRLTGHNTDVAGVLQVLDAHVQETPGNHCWRLGRAARRGRSGRRRMNAAWCCAWRRVIRRQRSMR